jgi:hypothetical protein
MLLKAIEKAMKAKMKVAILRKKINERRRKLAINGWRKYQWLAMAEKPGSA